MKQHTLTKMVLGTLVGAMTLITTSGVAHAKKSCTELPKDQWMSEEAFKKKVEAEGFVIKKFKQPGTCYEIHGTDPSGKKVEIYFNPVDGTPVKKK